VCYLSHQFPCLTACCFIEALEIESKTCFTCATAVVMISFSCEILFLNDADSIAYPGKVVAVGCCVKVDVLGVLDGVLKLLLVRGRYSAD